MTVPTSPTHDTPRERVLGAGYACVARYGFAKTAMADVAREADLSRATVYRLFPGGRDELFSAMVAWEMDRFFIRMAAAVADAPDFVAVVEGALVFAHREIREHAALQKVLATEPDRLLGFMIREQDRILGAVVAYLRPMLDAEAHAGRVVSGVDLDEAARYVATMGLSLMSTPGRFDLEDPAVVRDLVQRELLGGIRRDLVVDAPSTSGDPGTTRMQKQQMLLATGTPGRATIKNFVDTGTIVNYNPQVVLDLEVVLDGTDPYAAQITTSVPQVYLAKLQPGGSIGVRVDPADRASIAIDWAQP